MYEKELTKELFEIHFHFRNSFTTSFSWSPLRDGQFSHQKLDTVLYISWKSMISINSWNQKNPWKLFSRQLNVILKIVGIRTFCGKNFELFGSTKWPLMGSRMQTGTWAASGILEHTSDHLVDPKSSKFLSQKVLTKATFRIGFYCLEKKVPRIFLISRIYTIHYLNSIVKLFYKRDLLLIFQNAMMYNSSKTDIYRMALEMERDVNQQVV